MTSKLSIAILSVLAWILVNNAVSMCMGVEYFEDTVVTGRYVKLHKSIPGNDLPLNISEIEVYDSNGINVAKGASATSSSVLGPFIPEWLIDGNMDNFAHTTEGVNNWFMIDLGKEVPIKKVVVYNRKSCCQDRIIGSRVLIQDSARKEVYSSDKIIDVLPIYTFDVSAPAIPIASKINETVEQAATKVKVLSIVPDQASAANGILDKVKSLQDEADKKVVMAEMVKTLDVIPEQPVADPMASVAVPLSQDALRAKLEKEQAELDAKDLATNAPSSRQQTKFQPARVIADQVAEQLQQELQIKSVDLSKDTDADDFVLMDPQYWTELNVEKPLCNFRCELQPVIFSGVSKFLRVKNLKTSAAEKFLKN
jgi:hypothetical protein